jgi:hypothetical protein
VSNGKIVVWQCDGEKKDLIATQEIAIGAIEGKPNELLWKGMLCLLNQHRSLPLTIKGKVEPDGLVFSYSLNLVESLKNIRVEYIFTSKAAALGNSEAKTTIKEMIWEDKNRLGFFYAPPIQLRVQKEASLSYFYHIVPEVSPNTYTFQIKLKTGFLEDIPLMEKWQSLAQEYDSKGLLGKASVYYQKIIENFHFHPTIHKADKRLRELHEIFDKDRAEAGKMVEQARFFNTLFAYRSALEKCQQIQAKWDGLATASELLSLGKEAELQTLKLSKEEDERLTKRLWERAQDLETEESIGIAVLFYQEIIVRYSQSDLSKKATEKVHLLKEKLKQEGF